MNPRNAASTRWLLLQQLLLLLLIWMLLLLQPVLPKLYSSLCQSDCKSTSYMSSECVYSASSTREFHEIGAGIQPRRMAVVRDVVCESLLGDRTAIKCLLELNLLTWREPCRWMMMIIIIITRQAQSLAGRLDGGQVGWTDGWLAGWFDDRMRTMLWSSNHQWLVEEFIQSFVDTGGWKAAAGRGSMDMIGILFRGQRERESEAQWIMFKQIILISMHRYIRWTGWTWTRERGRRDIVVSCWYFCKGAEYYYYSWVFVTVY